MPPRPTFDGLTLAFGRIVIIEWLYPGDRCTGEELFHWMKAKGYESKRRIELYRPANATEFFRTLDTIAEETRNGSRWPLIHIEAHGNTEEEPAGYAHRNAAGEESLITWEELEPRLGAINLACECNLMLVSAACWGHAAILASCATERVPFIACVGFSTSVGDGALLDTMKEFYRQILGGTGMHLEDAVDESQRQLGSRADIACELMHGLSYETLEEEFRNELTPDVLRSRALDIAMRRLGGRIPNVGELPFSEALSLLHQEQAHRMQDIWDRRFMIDLFPANRARFGADIHALVSALIDREYSDASSAKTIATERPNE